jgi:hypothetical protein
LLKIAGAEMQIGGINSFISQLYNLPIKKNQFKENLYTSMIKFNKFKEENYYSTIKISEYFFEANTDKTILLYG